MTALIYYDGYLGQPTKKCHLLIEGIKTLKRSRTSAIPSIGLWVST